MAEENRIIRSMTTAQARRVSDAVLAVAREWLLDIGAEDGCYGNAGAFADFNRNCYVGVVTVDYTSQEGRALSGQIAWQFDTNFSVIGEPEVRQQPEP